MEIFNQNKNWNVNFAISKFRITISIIETSIFATQCCKTDYIDFLIPGAQRGAIEKFNFLINLMNRDLYTSNILHTYSNKHKYIIYELINENLIILGADRAAITIFLIKSSQKSNINSLFKYIPHYEAICNFHKTWRPTWGHKNFLTQYSYK